MGELAPLRRSWNASGEPMNPGPSTFEEFFTAEQDRLLRMMCLVTGSRGEAEDIAQEAFTRVFERWDKVAAMQDPAGYLHRTAVNVFRSRYRRAAIALKRTIAIARAPDLFSEVERDATCAA
jgi:RNA polymerase sigma-70 factor (ECF subfamily)